MLDMLRLTRAFSPVFLISTVACLACLVTLACLVSLAARPALAEAAAGAAAAEIERTVQIGRVQAYLDGLTTLTANFLQVAPDGSVSEGKLFLARPGGRVRLEYAPPSELLIVGSEGWIVLYDGATDQDSRWPVGNTPLGALIKDRIDLASDVLVEQVERAAGLVRLLLTNAQSPEVGALLLLFTEAPFELRQWQVIDAQNLVTTVTLSDIRHGQPLDPALFNYAFDELSFEDD